MTQQTQVSKKTSAPRQTAAHKAADAAEARRQHEYGIAPDERHHLINEMAYLIAEQRDFQGDMAMDDWLQAEAEVDGRSAGKH